MEVIVIAKIRTSAPAGNIIADAIHKAMTDALDAANLRATDVTQRINAVLAFQVDEVRPNSTVTKFITFPDVLTDLEKDLNLNKP